MSYDYDAALAAVVERPGSRVSELPGANGAVLRYPSGRRQGHGRG
jgi:hypothetical protein